MTNNPSCTPLLLQPRSSGVHGHPDSVPGAVLDPWGSPLCRDRAVHGVPSSPAARGVPFPSAAPAKPLPSLQNNSVSPSESLRASEKHRSSTEYGIDSKKRKAEEKDSMSRYVSDGDGLGLGGAEGRDLGVGRGIWGWEEGFGGGKWGLGVGRGIWGRKRDLGQEVEFGAGKQDFGTGSEVWGREVGFGRRKRDLGDVFQTWCG